ncbi:DMT family transporter [Zooshikella ganghwensis]|uniref:DMT family transporter n=1 Tax=Zooshikella ganghwensis TaxID=202772 RepID=UPI00040C5A0C|nr:DMT family transporter [Zooshikella ganghwensis]
MLVQVKNKSALGALLVCVAAAMWGFDGVVLTPRLWELDVSYVVFMVHALPFLGMQFFLYRHYKYLKKLSWVDIVFFILIAIFGGALGTLAIVKALFLVNFNNLTVVALLQKTQPIFAIILARFILKEPFSRHFFRWALLAIVGSYLLTFELNLPDTSNKDLLFEAACYALFAAFSFGSATVFGKRVLNKVPFQTALFFRYGFTTLVMLIIVLSLGTYQQLEVTTNTHWLFLIIIGLTTGSGAILLYYYGLRYIPANVSTICELCFPLFTVIFDYIFNGNILSPIQCFSALLMLFAIYRISRVQAYEQVKKDNSLPLQSKLTT